MSDSSDKQLIDKQYSEKDLSTDKQYSEKVFYTEYLSLGDLLQGRDKEYPPTPEMLSNGKKLIARVNYLLTRFHAQFPYVPAFKVSSGYRPGHYNKQAGGAKFSKHLTCSAIDLADPGNHLDEWISSMGDGILCLARLDREDPTATNGWVHLDLGQRRMDTYITFKV